MARAQSEKERAREIEQGTVKDDQGRILYWARRPFGYDGQDLDRGQIVGLRGARNDEKLIRLGYVLALIPENKPFACRKCSATFIDLNTLNAHGDKHHGKKAPRTDVPYSAKGNTVDDTAGDAQRFEKEQQRMDQDAPLNLDKTAASARG